MLFRIKINEIILKYKIVQFYGTSIDFYFRGLFFGDVVFIFLDFFRLDFFLDFFPPSMGGGR